MLANRMKHIIKRVEIIHELFRWRTSGESEEAGRLPVTFSSSVARLELCELLVKVRKAEFAGGAEPIESIAKPAKCPASRDELPKLLMPRALDASARATILSALERAKKRAREERGGAAAAAAGGGDAEHDAAETSSLWWRPGAVAAPDAQAIAEDARSTDELVAHEVSSWTT